MKKFTITIFITTILANAGSVAAIQDSGAEESTSATSGQGFDDAAAIARKRLEDSLKELAALRNRIAEESIPLSRELNELQAEYEALQVEYREVDRLHDVRSLDIIRLTEENQRREDQAVHLRSMLGEFVTEWGAGLPIAEQQRHANSLDLAGNARFDEALSGEDIHQIQADVVQLAIDRIDEAFGGMRFEGRALDPEGEMTSGMFLLVGPAQFFGSKDGKTIGPVRQRINSAEPSVVAYASAAQTGDAGVVIENARGNLPIDATLGNARIMEETEETILEHVLKGGVVVWPILALGFTSLLVAIFKWIELVMIPRPGKERLEMLATAVREHREEDALSVAHSIPGPTGAMLISGVEHIHEPKDLIDEILYEKILVTRLRVQKFLPFIALSAAAAPLLGLLGTVVGIIETFRMIMLLGTGDVQTLSDGIYQALITTQVGLVVAIPALLLHAFLSRQARAVTDRMVQAALSFVNTVAVANPKTSRSGSTLPDPLGATDSERNETREALVELLGPLLDRTNPTPSPGTKG